MIFFDFVAHWVPHALPLSSISFSMQVTLFSFWLGLYSDWLSQAFVLSEWFLFASLFFLSSGYRVLWWVLYFLFSASCFVDIVHEFVSRVWCFLSVVSCNFYSNPLSRPQSLGPQCKSSSSLLLLSCDLFFLPLGVLFLSAVSLKWTSSTGCSFSFSDFVVLLCSLFFTLYCMFWKHPWFWVCIRWWSNSVWCFGDWIYQLTNVTRRDLIGLKDCLRHIWYMSSHFFNSF